MSEQKEEEIIVRDKWHGCPNSFCPACVNARKDTEHELGRPITSKENYLIEPEKKKKLKHKKI